MNIIGDKVKDKCYQLGSDINEFSTITKDQCLKTCQGRMVQGCEFRDMPVKPECIIQTKYVIGATGRQNLGDYKNTCWKFESGRFVIYNRRLLLFTF